MTERLSVSVVIPCYNAAAFLPETIASVKAQTRTPNEIIIVDDASQDASVSVAEAAGVRVIRMPENGGVAAARNAGLAAASAECVAFLDADDIWLPFHLETTLSLLEAHPQVALAFGLVKSFGVSDETQKLEIPPNTPVDAFMQLYSGGGICMPSAMIVRRMAALGIGGFLRTRVGHAEDYDFTVRLAQKHPIIGSPVVVSRYRKTGHGLSTARQANRVAEFESRFLLLERARADQADNIPQLEAGLRKALDWRFETAWTARDGDLIQHYAMLGEQYVPASKPLIAEWKRKARMLPLVRGLDLVPAPIARNVRRLARSLFRR